VTVVPEWTSSRFVGRMALRAAAGVSLAYILLPMFFVIWLAFFAQEIPSFPPEGYSLKWFRAIPGNDRFVNGFLLSLQVAVVSTLIGLAIGVPAAVCWCEGASPDARR
jgi:putative spermidine/putrescine transport system permease protein